MLYICNSCGRKQDSKNPQNVLPSKEGYCFRCFPEDRQDHEERSYLVTEGLANGKDYVQWIKHGRKDPSCYGNNGNINRWTGYTQRFQRIGRKK